MRFKRIPPAYFFGDKQGRLNVVSRTAMIIERWSGTRLFLIVYGLIVLVIPITLSAQTRAAKITPKAVEVLEQPLLVVKPDEDTLPRLKKLKFNAALSEAKERYGLYQRGLTQLSELMEVGQRVLRAQVDLYDKPEDRVRILEKQVEIYSEGEANLEKQVKSGTGTKADLERLRYNMYSVEIDLQNAKSLANGTSSGGS
jgi:hypothetical protein